MNIEAEIVALRRWVDGAHPDAIPGVPVPVLRRLFAMYDEAVQQVNAWVQGD